MSNQYTASLPSPEDGLILNPLVVINALDGPITAIIDRTKALYIAIEQLLTIEAIEIEETTICNYFWQMQGNIDLLGKYLEAYLSDVDYSLLKCLTDTIIGLSSDVICDYCSIKAPPLPLDSKLDIRRTAVFISYQLEVIKELFKNMQCREAKQ